VKLDRDEEGVKGVKPMLPDPTKEQEYRDEAARLAQLAKEDQREIIALHRYGADRN
jgi:hypothetical protein